MSSKRRDPGTESELEGLREVVQARVADLVKREKEEVLTPILRGLIQRAKVLDRPLAEEVADRLKARIIPSPPPPPEPEVEPPPPSPTCPSLFNRPPYEDGWGALDGKVPGGEEVYTPVLDGRGNPHSYCCVTYASANKSTGILNTGATVGGAPGWAPESPAANTTPLYDFNEAAAGFTDYFSVPYKPGAPGSTTVTVTAWARVLTWNRLVPFSPYSHLALEPGDTGYISGMVMVTGDLFLLVFPPGQATPLINQKRLLWQWVSRDPSVNSSGGVGVWPSDGWTVARVTLALPNLRPAEDRELKVSVVARVEALRAGDSGANASAEDRPDGWAAVSFMDWSFTDPHKGICPLDGGSVSIPGISVQWCHPPSLIGDVTI